LLIGKSTDYTVVLLAELSEGRDQPGYLVQ
jgi:hypothetical protein